MGFFFRFSFFIYFLFNTWFHLRLWVVLTLCSASCLPSCPPYVTWTCQKCSCSCSQVRAGTLVQTLVTERPSWWVQNMYCTNHPSQMFPSLTDVNGNYSSNIPNAVDFIRHVQYDTTQCVVRFLVHNSGSFPVSFHVKAKKGFDCKMMPLHNQAQ